MIMQQLKELIGNLRPIAAVLLPAIVAAVALAAYFAIFVILSHNQISDFVGALKNTKSYYIVIQQSSQDAVPEMDTSAITYEGYVENADGKAMLKINGSSEFNEIIVGNGVYDNADGKWTESGGGLAIISNLNNSILTQGSDEELRASGNTTMGILPTHIYTYSNTPRDMSMPFYRSVYWLTDNNIPIRVVHSVDHEMGSTTTTIEISKVNEPVAITAPEVK